MGRLKWSHGQTAERYKVKLEENCIGKALHRRGEHDGYTGSYTISKQSG